MTTKFISFKTNSVDGSKEEQVCRWIDEHPDAIIKGMISLSYEITIFYQRIPNIPLQDPQKDSIKQDDFFRPFDWDRWVPHYEPMKVWCGDVLDYPRTSTFTCLYQEM